VRGAKRETPAGRLTKADSHQNRCTTRTYRLRLVGTKLNKERAIAHCSCAVLLAVEHLGAVVRVFYEQASVEHGRVSQCRAISAAELPKRQLGLLNHWSTHMARASDAVPKRPAVYVAHRARDRTARTIWRMHIVCKCVGLQHIRMLQSVSHSCVIACRCVKMGSGRACVCR